MWILSQNLTSDKENKWLIKYANWPLFDIDSKQNGL